METKTRKISCNKYVCEICDYTTSRKSSINSHLLSAKHENNDIGNKNAVQNTQQFSCDICRYTTSRKDSMRVHQLTVKHINKCKNSENVVQNIQQFSCDICSKLYNTRTGLWKHQKKCEANMKETDGITTQMFCDMLKQNNEFKELIMKKDNEFKEIIVEQNNKIIELTTKVATNNNIISKNIAKETIICKI